jgi:AcrR family transcriptional regulator
MPLMEIEEVALRKTDLTSRNTAGINIPMVFQLARMSREERKAQTREELLAAGDRLFREQGFHGASLDQVAAAAGYTKGAVYSNFVSKEDLFLAIYERRVDASLKSVARVLEEHGDDGPAELTRNNLTRPDQGWMAVFFEFWAHVLRNPEPRARFLSLHRRAQEPLVAHARGRLAAGGDLDAESWTLANVAMVNGLQLEQLSDPGLDAAQLAVAMFDAAVKGLR